MSIYRITLLLMLTILPPIATLASEPKHAPELSTSEHSTFSRVLGQAFRAPLEDADFDSLRFVCQHYIARTGTRWTRSEIRALNENQNLTYRYNVELGRCLLLSLDSGSPFYSKAYSDLAQQMAEAGFARKAKLDSDRMLLVSTARHTRSTNEFGELFEPLTRESILASNARLEAVRPNFEMISQILEHYAK
jgi:hypothetical protein